MNPGLSFNGDPVTSKGMLLNVTEYRESLVEGTFLRAADCAYFLSQPESVPVALTGFYRTEKWPDGRPQRPLAAATTRGTLRVGQVDRHRSRPQFQSSDSLVTLYTRVRTHYEKDVWSVWDIPSLASSR